MGDPETVRGTEVKLSVSKASLVENVHQEFYTLFNAISGFANNVYPAFPYKDLDANTSKNSYPIFVLESPDIDVMEKFTLSKLNVEGTITLEIYTSSAKTADEYASDAFDKIETSISSLRENGLRFIAVSGMNKNVVQRGKVNVHVKTVTWNFQFIFTRSSLPY